MPELPEVEVVKRSLINKAQNSIIKSVKINDGKLRYKVDKNQIKRIIGLKIQKISRRSKYLLFFFNKDIVMLVHLGMTGKFFFINQKNNKYKTSFYYDLNDSEIKGWKINGESILNIKNTVPLESRFDENLLRAIHQIGEISLNSEKDAQKYVDNAKSNLGIDDPEEVRSPRRSHRRSITGDATFDDFEFENNNVNFLYKNFDYEQK